MNLYLVKSVRTFSKLFIALIFCSFIFVSNATANASTGEVTLENDTLKVIVDSSTGCFSVDEKITGQQWSSDPWEQAAGLLTLNDVKGKPQIVNLSKCEKITVKSIDQNSVEISFENPSFEDGTFAEGVAIHSKISLDENSAKLDVQVTNYETGKYRLVDLRYPAREFSLSKPTRCTNIGLNNIYRLRLQYRITSYNVCYTKLLRFQLNFDLCF